MDRIEFNELLKNSGLSKREFSEILGVSYNTVNGWGSPQNVPYWVESWLENYIKAKNFDDAKRIFCGNSR